jgi:hypothetical protein
MLHVAGRNPDRRRFRGRVILGRYCGAASQRVERLADQRGQVADVLFVEGVEVATVALVA